MGTMSEISELKHRISRYKSKIAKLESAAETIRQEQAIIESDVLKPNRAYDMSNVDEWRGSLHQEAKDIQSDIDNKISIGLRGTNTLLSKIQEAIEKLYELIRECEDEISELEARLCSENM